MRENDELLVLHRAYEEFIADISRVIPVIKVNWSTFQSTEDVAASIREEYLKISAIRRVDFAATPGNTTGGPSFRPGESGSTSPAAPQLSHAKPPTVQLTAQEVAAMQ